MTTAASRIYVVTHKPTGQVRLVRAKSNISAINHVVGSAFECKQSNSDDIVKYAVTNGIAVEESAVVTPPAPPAPPTPPAPPPVPGAEPTGIVIQPASFDPSAQPNA